LSPKTTFPTLPSHEGPAADACTHVGNTRQTTWTWRGQGDIAYQRRNAQQQGSGSGEDLKRSRSELLKVQKKNAELAYRKQMGELLEFDEVETVVCEGAAIFTGQKRSIGSRLAGTLAGMSDPKAILKLLNSENDKILLELSKNSTAWQIGALHNPEILGNFKCKPG